MDLVHEAAKVATPIGLIAFLAAVAFYAYGRRLAERRKIIAHASDKDRRRLIEGAIRDFTIVNTNSLTNDQKFQLINDELKHRMRRFLIASVAAVTVTLGSFATYLIVQNRQALTPAKNAEPWQAPKPQPKMSDNSSQPFPPTGPQSPVKDQTTVARPAAVAVDKSEHVASSSAGTKSISESGPTDLIALRHKDRVGDLSDDDNERRLSQIPAGVLGYIPPWQAPPCDGNSIDPEVSRRTMGTSTLELHKLESLKIKMVVFVQAKVAETIQARTAPLALQGYAGRWEGHADIPVSISFGEIRSCESHDTDEHGRRFDMTLAAP